MIRIAEASSHLDAANDLLTKIQDVILFPLMYLMMSFAVLFFLWGAYQFVANAESEAGRDTGKKHMVFGIIGLLIMISAYAILKIAANTVGCDIETPGGCGT